MFEIDKEININNFTQYALHKQIKDLHFYNILTMNKPKEREEMLRYTENIYNPIVSMFESIGGANAFYFLLIPMVLLIVFVILIDRISKRDRVLNS